MPRITQEQMKIDEEKVIKLLLKKANESIDSIAKKCGFSRQKAWRIIKRLEKNKTIWGYHAVIDKEKLNMKTYVLLIKASLKPIKSVDEKIGDIIDEKDADKLGIMVVYSSYIHGTFDWIVIFHARNTKQAKMFTHKICKRNSDVIARVELSEEMFVARDSGFLNPNLDKIKEYLFYE
jgi:DNA-binding Lrp family transcriptional regulator